MRNDIAIIAKVFENMGEPASIRAYVVAAIQEAIRVTREFDASGEVVDYNKAIQDALVDEEEHVCEDCFAMLDPDPNICVDCGAELCNDCVVIGDEKLCESCMDDREVDDDDEEMNEEEEEGEEEELEPIAAPCDRSWRQ